jgi:hypothetical protein
MIEKHRKGNAKVTAIHSKENSLYSHFNVRTQSISSRKHGSEMIEFAQGLGEENQDFQVELPEDATG